MNKIKGCQATSHLNQSSKWPYRTWGRCHLCHDLRYTRWVKLRLNAIVAAELITKKDTDYETSSSGRLSPYNRGKFVSSPRCTSLWCKIRGKRVHNWVCMYSRSHLPHAQRPKVYSHIPHRHLVPESWLAYHLEYSTEKVTLNNIKSFKRYECITV